MTTLTLPDGMDDLSPPETFIKEVKADAKSKVLIQENERIFEHVQTLMKQGNYLELTKLQGSDATWQSFIFNLPRGTMTQWCYRAYSTPVKRWSIS